MAKETLTLKEVNLRYAGLLGLSDLKLPIKLKYAITRNMDAMKGHVERINKMNTDIAERYAEKEEDGKPRMVESVINNDRQVRYDISPKNELEMNQEFKHFLEEETVEIEVYRAPLKLLEEAEENEKFSIPTVAQQQAMYFMLDE